MKFSYIITFIFLTTFSSAYCQLDSLIQLHGAERELLNIINWNRSQRNLPILIVNKTLDSLSKIYAYEWSIENSTIDSVDEYYGGRNLLYLQLSESYNKAGEIYAKVENINFSERDWTAELYKKVYVARSRNFNYILKNYYKETGLTIIQDKRKNQIIVVQLFYGNK